MPLALPVPSQLSKASALVLQAGLPHSDAQMHILPSAKNPLQDCLMILNLKEVKYLFYCEHISKNLEEFQIWKLYH